jgi:hypothetical protein
MATIDSASLTRTNAYTTPPPLPSSNTIAYANTAKTNQDAVIRASNQSVNQNSTTTDGNTTTSQYSFGNQSVPTTGTTADPDTGAPTAFGNNPVYSSEPDATNTTTTTNTGSTTGSGNATTVQVSQQTLASYKSMTSQVDKMVEQVLGSKYKAPGDDHKLRTQQVNAAYKQLEKSSSSTAEQFKKDVHKLSEPFQLNYGMTGQTKRTIGAEAEAIRAAAEQQFYGTATTAKGTSTPADTKANTNTNGTTSTPGTSRDLTLSQTTKDKLAEIQYLGCSEGVGGLEYRLRSASARRGEGGNKVTEGTVLDTFKMSTQSWSEIKGRIDLNQGTAGVARQLNELSNNVPQNVMSADPTRQSETATTA